SVEGRGNDCAALRAPRLPTDGPGRDRVSAAGDHRHRCWHRTARSALRRVGVDDGGDVPRSVSLHGGRRFLNLLGPHRWLPPSVALASVTVFGGPIWATAVLLALSMLITAAGGVLAGRAAHNDALMD